MTETATPDGPQELVLRSVLTGWSIPGTTAPVRPADLGMATDPDGTVRVLDVDLTPAAAELVAAPRTRARLVTEADALRPDPGGVSAVLRVRPPEFDEGDARARVRLEVCAPRDDTLLPLDATTVLLRREAGTWVAEGPPTQLAT